MEKIYNVFKHIKDKNYTLTRKEYFITIVLYNILAYMFVGILVNGFELITRQAIDVWNIMPIFAFIICLPLYSSQYHRLLDTGMIHKYALTIPIIGFILKLINIILPFLTEYYSSSYFGTGTLQLFNGLHLDPDSKYYTFTAIFMMIQALYMLTNLILILTKTNQFKPNIKKS